MAVGNPVMQRMLSERRAALGLPVRDPQESDPTRQQPSNPTDYFENIVTWSLPRKVTSRLRRNLALHFTRNYFRRKHIKSFTTKSPLRRKFYNETYFEQGPVIVILLRSNRSGVLHFCDVLCGGLFFFVRKIPLVLVFGHENQYEKCLPHEEENFSNNQPPQETAISPRFFFLLILITPMIMGPL
ncbi:hypothetical protein YC2023_083737 [Brassica napus]